MALIVCPHCGNQVSENANMCPSCGNNPHQKPRKKWKKKEYIILFSVITAVIAVVVLLFLALRPDPYLKKGRLFLTEKYEEFHRECSNNSSKLHLEISDNIKFDISDFIEEEWDRKSCVKHFNIPLENDPVYSICAYQFCNISNNDIRSMDDASALFLTLLGSKTIFVVFRNGEPMNTRDQNGLADEMNSKICVVKKDGKSIPLDFHDCLELEYIDISYSNPNEAAKRAGEYVEQKYGSYEVICSCNSVNQRTVDLAEDNSEESAEAGVNALGFVDLGLPSGTLWKDKNETGGNNNFFTYAQAVNQFGNKLPTEEQFKELQKKCRWTWTGDGYRVAGPNGNSIFLPAEGRRYCSCSDDVGFFGYYWSSSPSSPESACYLDFDSDAVYVITCDRCCGQSVRLVQ